MSFWSWLKGEEKTVVQDVAPVEKTVVRDVTAFETQAVQDFETFIKPLENELEADRIALRANILQTMNDTRAALKNAETALSEDALAAVNKLIADVTQVLAQDANKNAGK